LRVGFITESNVIRSLLPFLWSSVSICVDFVATVIINIFDLLPLVTGNSIYFLVVRNTNIKTKHA